MVDSPVNLPPAPRLLDYPATAVIVGCSLMAIVLLIVAGRFDPTHGVLTISLLVVLSFMAVATFTVFFTVPTDEVTSLVIGGLISAFGGVIGYWLGRPRDGGK